MTEEGFTNGAPLAMLTRNKGARSSDYLDIANKFRPGHADWTYFQKYGLPPQPGGGRSSGRETVSRVMAGAIARSLLGSQGIKVNSGTICVGTIVAKDRDYEFAETNPLRFLDPLSYLRAEEEIKLAMKAGDSIGSAVEVVATGVPVGWGEPVFGKLEALLGGAFFSIGAVRAVEFGEGIANSKLRGSEVNEPIGPEGPKGTSHGGVLGGISTGKPIIARLFIRPTPSISLPQRTVDLSKNNTGITIMGRHDPLLAPRLGPVAEAMCLLVLADLSLERRARVD
jgi:chorismate synthase